MLQDSGPEDAEPMLMRWIERSAWVVGFTLLGTYGGMRLWAQESSTKAVQEFRAMSVAPADQALWSHQRVVAYQEAQRAGDVPEAVLRLPSLALEVPVYGDTNDLNLDRDAGRIPGTATLDQAGNLGIAAHRDGFFRKLKDAAIGMDVYLEHGGRTERYHITEISIVTPDDGSVLAPTARRSITLVTCYPFYFVGSAPQRYIVRAELDEVQTRNEVPFQLNRRET